MYAYCLRRHVKKAAARSLPELADIFSQWVDFAGLPDPDRRRRLFPVQVTFWLFLSQILGRCVSCSEVVKKAVAWSHFHNEPIPSTNTSAYCQARKRLPHELISGISARVLAALPDKTERRWLWHGHQVKIVDATHISMDDTRANARCFGYPQGVRTGCGFPALKVLAVFSLQHGGLIGYLEARNRRSEQSLFRSLWKRVFDPGDVMLGDRFYCTYANTARLSAHGVFLVVRQNASLSTSLHLGKRLGKNDRLCEWRRHKMRTLGFSRAAWNNLPKSIALRQVRVRVAIPGMRTKNITILTTLLDHRRYPAADIAELYYRRWQIELDFRDIKISMGMGYIACKTPEMVRKQLALHVVAYNLVRLLMLESSTKHNTTLDRLSFKGALDSVHQFAPLLACATNRRLAIRLHEGLLACIAHSLVIERPGRREPRAVKRRDVANQPLNRRRRGFVEKSKRERYCKSERSPTLVTYYSGK